MAMSIEEVALGPAEQAAKVEEAKAALAALRRALGEFHSERAKTREMVEGRRKSRFGPVFAAETVTEFRRRNAEQERQAAGRLRDLMALVLGRDPQVSELVAPPEPTDEALGFLPLLPLAAIVGGAWALASLFSWLAEQERSAQAAAGMQHTWAEAAARAVPYVGPLLLVGAIGVGGWALWREVKGESVLTPAKKLFGAVKGKGAGKKRKRRKNPSPKPWTKPWEAEPEDEPEDAGWDEDETED